MYRNKHKTACLFTLCPKTCAFLLKRRHRAVSYSRQYLSISKHFYLANREAASVTRHINGATWCTVICLSPKTRLCQLLCVYTVTVAFMQLSLWLTLACMCIWRLVSGTVNFIQPGIPAVCFGNPSTFMLPLYACSLIPHG